MLSSSRIASAAAPSRTVRSAPLEDLARAHRLHRQHRRPVVDREDPLVKDQLQLALLQHAAVLVAEDRQQHLVLELALQRLPVDVEEQRVLRRRAILQHVHPPRVRRLRDPHVVRHEVDDDPHAGLRHFAGEARVLLPRRHLGIELIVIVDVVAVRAPRRRLEDRRQVEMRDAQLLQVRHERARHLDREVLVELQPIRRARDVGVSFHRWSRRSPSIRITARVGRALCNSARPAATSLAAS